MAGLDIRFPDDDTMLEQMKIIEGAFIDRSYYKNQKLQVILKGTF